MEAKRNPKTGSYKNYSFERLLIEASHILNQDLELSALLKNILHILTDYLEAEASAILITSNYENRSELFTYVTNRDLVHNIDVDEEYKGIANLVFDSRKSVIINQNQFDDQLRLTVNKKLDIDTRNVMASPIVRKGMYHGVIEVFNKLDGKDFDDNDLETMNALGDQIALAIANAKLIRRARRRTAEAKSLIELGKLMSGTLELEELLKIIVEQASKLIKVDMATIYIVDPTDVSIKDIVTQGVPDQLRAKLPMKIGEGICGQVAKTGETAVINDVTTNCKYIQLHPEIKSEAALPLKSQGKVIGVFNVESVKLNAYKAEDIELLETFASQVAVSIERAMLYEQAIEQKYLEDELNIARRIQKTFLPNANPEIADFDIAGVNIPSKAVGGDYYDFIDIVDNQIGIAIGDVSGKGIGAALIMAAFRASLKAEIRNNYAIRTIFSKVNSLLYESIDRGNYVTAVYGVLDTKNKVFTFSNAGHNPPMLFKKSGQVVELSEGGLILGMFPDSKYEERPIYISRGDILLFYTDGVTEAQDIDDREYGTERLQNLIIKARKKTAAEILDLIYESIKKFKGLNQPLDDLTMVLVKSL